MIELKNAEDFKWYKAKLDLEAQYERDHINEPLKYPCLVVSEYDPDDTG